MPRPRIRLYHEPAAERPAGHAFYVPAERRPGGDKGDRLHPLVNRCAVPEPATVVYMTTSDAEERFGARVHEIPDTVLRERGQRGSFVVPCRILSISPTELNPSIFNLADQLPAVRSALARTLGMGSGVGAPERDGSLRGRLVRLSDEVRRLYLFRYGVIVTEPAYSARRRWQVIVPVAKPRTGAVPSGDDVAVEDFANQPWRSALPAGWDRAWLRPQYAFSASHRFDARDPVHSLDAQVADVLAGRIDPAHLDGVERVLRRRLGLH